MRGDSKTNRGILYFFNKSIGNKLYSVLGVVSLVVLLIILVANFTSSTLTMVTSFARMERVHSVALTEAKASFYRYLIFKDAALLQSFENNIQKAYAYSHTFGQLPHLMETVPHKELVLLFDETFTEVGHRESDIIVTRTGLLLWNPIVKNLIQIAEETSKITDQYHKLINQYSQEEDDYQKNQVLNEIKQLEAKLEILPKKFSDATGDLSNFASGVVKTALWILFVILLLVCMATIIPVAKAITGSLRRITHILQDVAEGQGDLTVQLPVESKDEIGVLASNFNIFMSKIRNTIKEVKLSIDTQVRITQEIKSNSDHLSSLASKQASNVEEISGSMGQVKASISHNSSNAHKTSDIAGNVSAKASDGGKAVSETVINMRDINNKISIIEQIAFQINLLALNASVEAAHAGQNGRGFAVVANEVKKLAEKTKMAAQEINLLVENSMVSSELAGKVVGDILPELSNTAKFMKDISAATEEQNTSVQHVGESMSLLSQISSENAAMSEELASAALVLSEQANKLESTINSFKVD